MSDHCWVGDKEPGEGWDAMCCTCGWLCKGPLPNCLEAWKQHMIEVWERPISNNHEAVNRAVVGEE